MKSCLRIPRFLIPNTDMERWAVISYDQYADDRNYWERVARGVGDTPSSIHFIYPKVYFNDGETDYVAEIQENMYTALEQGWIGKTERGLILVERETSFGTRKGLLVCLDLEEYAVNPTANGSAITTESITCSQVTNELSVRRRSILEFSSAIALYRDKKNKIIKSLEQEDLQEIYNFRLMQGGGWVRGYFVPDYIAIDVVQELCRLANPAFAVVEGNSLLLAAKTYWDEIKNTLSEQERRNHPARFAMVEMVNAYDDGVVLCPVHRIIRGIETETFCSYVLSACKCERKGRILIPNTASTIENAIKIDDLILNYLRENGGEVAYTQGKDIADRLDADSVLVQMPSLTQDEIFDRIKKGREFPKKLFTIGNVEDKRYYIEGREISYD